MSPAGAGWRAEAKTGVNFLVKKARAGAEEDC